LLVGDAEEIDDLDLKRRIWQGEWKIHWPAGPEESEFIMLKILPEWAKVWYRKGSFGFKIK